MLDNLSVNWWGALVATILVTILAGAYFTAAVTGPLFYGLINAPYFLLASLIVSASLVLVG